MDNMSTNVLPPTSITSNVSAAIQIKNKRKRRAPPSGAADDCYSCKENGRCCDRKRPYCTQCIDLGGVCSGYRTTLTWNVGVASRGKLRGLTLPIPLTKEEQAKRNAALPSPAAKKEEKKRLKIATAAATGAGISKPLSSSVAAAASLASLRNMNYDFVNMEQAGNCDVNIQKTIVHYNPSRLVTSNPSPQFQQYSPMHAQSQQYQKLMNGSPQQGGLSLLLSPMSEFSAGQPYYHHDGASTPEVYSPMFSPADSNRSDSGFLDSPYHSRSNSGDYDYLNYTRSHPQSIPTSVPGHMNDMFDEQHSLGQSSPSIYSHHNESLRSSNGADGDLSALLYEEDMGQMQPYMSRSNTHPQGHYHNQSCSPQTCNSSPQVSPSPPPLVHGNGTPSSSYYYAYSPSSPQDISTPPPMSGVPPQLQLSYPPTPSSLSPSTPASPLHCQPPTSSGGSTMPLTSSAMLMQQQMYHNQNALAHSQASHTYILPGTNMAHEQQYYFSS